MIQLLLASLLKDKKKLRFIKYNIIAIFVFALLYWLQERFIYLYPELSKSLGFGSTSSDIDGFYYWLWFSALTQTTVGYSGPMTSKGISIPYDEIPNRVYKVINLIQLFSIFFTFYS
jgi:hypothetical protein